MIVKYNFITNCSIFIRKACLALPFLLLGACVQEIDAPVEKMATQSTKIDPVRAWFEANKGSLRLPERGSNFRTESQELILPFFEKEPDWDKVHHYFFPDGREVFEINLKNFTKYYPTSLLDSFPNRNPVDVVIQNILFVKHPTKERFDPVILRYYPANSTNEKTFEEMSYQAIDYDWSGTIEIFTYDEHHFVGFEIKEGKVVRDFTRKPFEGEKKKSTANMDVRCTTHYYPVGYQACAGSSCHTTILYYIAETSCSGGDLGTTKSYQYPTGVPSLGGNPTTDGNGTCSTCEYNPPSLTMPGLLNKLTNPCASELFKQVKRSGIQSGNQTGNFNIDQEILKLFEESAKYDYVIQNSDNSTTTTPHFNTDTRKPEFVVNLNNTYLSTATQLSIVRTIIHESLHAYISYKIDVEIEYKLEFEKDYSEYLKARRPSDINRAQHELMGSYVETMAYSLKQWDRIYGNGKLGNPLLEDNYYRAMAFGGLFRDGSNIPTDSFKALIPSGIERMNILKIIFNEQEGTDSKGTKCN